MPSDHGLEMRHVRSSTVTNIIFCMLSPMGLHGIGTNILWANPIPSQGTSNALNHDGLEGYSDQSLKIQPNSRRTCRLEHQRTR